MKPLTFGTFCSGIGAPEASWTKLGWKPLFTSEIEPFPCAILAHHYPNVPNLGDMEKITDETLGRFKPDVVCAGTPCQSFSIAGLRARMADARGNLALVFLRHLDRLRPRWMVWENVPGVLSSWSDETEGEGERWQSNDFDTFLSRLRELGYGIAWRILNAEYFGVPQRRRRVFVVGYLGDWRRAAAVLFERFSLSGNPPPRREKGKGFAADVAPCIDASGVDFARIGDIRGQDPVIALPQIVGCLSDGAHMGKGLTDRMPIPGELSRCLNAGGMGRLDYETETLIPMTGSFFSSNATAPLAQSPYADNESRESLLVARALRADGFDASEDGTGRGTPIVPIVYTIHGTGKTVKVASETCVAGSIRTKPPGSQENSSTTVVLAFSCKDHGADASAVSPTLRGMGHSGSHANAGGQVAVARALHSENSNSMRNGQCPAAKAVSTARSLDSNGGFSQNQGGNLVSGPSMAVRRLLPIECERLQGTPDHYTKIDWSGWRKMGVDETPESCRIAGMEVRQGKNGKWRVKDVDGPRYKAIGNSMALPCLTWLGKRIQLVDSLEVV